MFQFDPSRAGIVIKNELPQEVCVSTSLLQHHTRWSFSRSNQTSFMTIWIGMNDTSMVLLVYVPVWSIQGRNCNQKWTSNPQEVCVSTSLLQHHTQWSFSKSNQTSFMTIWIGMNDTSMVLLVYVPVWSIQGRNCNQKWTFTGSVWFNLQLYFNITPYEASVDPTKLLLWLFG